MHSNEEASPAGRADDRSRGGTEPAGQLPPSTREEEGPTYEVLRSRTVVWLAVLMFAIGIGVAAWLVLAYGRGDPQNSLEAIKTAGTIVIGSGGAVALWLAVRRQRTAELAIAQKDRELRQKDRDQDHTARDAVERRATELYTMAAVQLGSEHAHVRIAGIYALERLAQNNPDQRQVIVNVLCAYLRMPHTTDDTDPAEPDPDRELRRTQERQVRLTAQRLLATHLRRGGPADAFWPGITLDLAGATLLDFNLERCHLHGATFAGARFHGATDFSLAEFTGPLAFDNARFTGGARFINTVCAEPVDFTQARFDHDATFAQATFRSSATFKRTQFDGKVEFSGTRFDYVWFDNARFAQTAMFDGARFIGPAEFGGDKHSAPHFNGCTYFRAAQFEKDVVFGGTRFGDTVVFDDAVFHEFAGFNDAVFAGSAIFTETKLLAEARFRRTRFDGKALFGGSEFGRHANFDSTLFGAEVWFSDVTFSGAATCAGAYARLDVDDVRIWPSGWLLATPPAPDTVRLPDMPGRWGRLYDR
ncbi:Pentapeptide repeat-containing protein [Amycolatopsis xylanica]|uniref:Pentapeptide repeat-containing protein n=1 Tax=Amycolatopsis xylanica TaxID=589385 RepID=A0A1H2SXP9_9PSEU|nr:pentapeptide repeat-containing protein [Amycolatopsis xylanica]SDW36411.1 Pentapeptide repeat-containing protein [Amycolatopsis xylanica]